MHEVSTEWSSRGYWVTVADADGQQTRVMVHPGKPVYGCRLDIQVGRIDRCSKLDYTEPEFGWVEACLAADKPAVIAAFSVWAANVVMDHLKADGATDVNIRFGCDSRIIIDYADHEHEPMIMEVQASFMSYNTEPDLSSIAALDAVVVKTALDRLLKPHSATPEVSPEC